MNQAAQIRFVCNEALSREFFFRGFDDPVTGEDRMRDAVERLLRHMATLAIIGGRPRLPILQREPATLLVMTS